MHAIDTFFWQQIPQIHIVIFPNFESYAVSEINKNTCYDYNMYILYLGSILMMNTLFPVAVYFGTQNLFLVTWRFSHLGVTTSTRFPENEMMIKFGFHSQGLIKLQEGLRNIMTYLQPQRPSSRDKKLKLLTT